ncbi:hypothetical protein BDP27DRAFT_1371895 [Rhodocollybia butyracea]|uniref:Uncharacterized protein n=1 Tax=Rhodocollybia butyracea TaxID=206335 RepID=A0A9P5TXR8_9AGAR|nr:hypothetical protein BDP27DRAFT_1371895 [Rhodocollybia butyracea]
MSSSNTELQHHLLIFFKLTSATTVAVSVDKTEIEDTNLQQVATIVKAFKEGTALDASYDAVLKAIMENEKSQSGMAADFPDAIEITRSTKESLGSSIETQLNPPFGTKGFSNQTYKVAGTDWNLNVYAYRHANSNDVTLIVLHSGSISGAMNLSVLWTTPATAYKFQYPVTYDSKLGDDRYSYTIDYTNSINMIGPDGKNPIVFKASIKKPLLHRAWQVSLLTHTWGFFKCGLGKFMESLSSVFHSKSTLLCSLSSNNSLRM